MRIPLLLAALAASLLGCPPAERPPAAKAACTKMYEQCALEGGKLGVCDVLVGAKCASPPCLVCVDQH